MGFSSFECNTNFCRKKLKKRPKRRLILIQILKNRCVINATAAPLIREIKTTLAVVTCTSFMANSLWFSKNIFANALVKNFVFLKTILSLLGHFLPWQKARHDKKLDLKILINFVFFALTSLEQFWNFLLDWDLLALVASSQKFHHSPFGHWVRFYLCSRRWTLACIPLFS